MLRLIDESCCCKFLILLINIKFLQKPKLNIHWFRTRTNSLPLNHLATPHCVQITETVRFFLINKMEIGLYYFFLNKIHYKYFINFTIFFFKLEKRTRCIHLKVFLWLWSTFVDFICLRCLSCWTYLINNCYLTMFGIVQN